jgi:hypothetical protein
MLGFAINSSERALIAITSTSTKSGLRERRCLVFVCSVEEERERGRGGPWFLKKVRERKVSLTWLLLSLFIRIPVGIWMNSSKQMEAGRCCVRSDTSTGRRRNCPHFLFFFLDRGRQRRAPLVGLHFPCQRSLCSCTESYPLF